MSELLGYSILAFGAGLLLNFVPCVLPIIPVKIYTVLREIKGDIRSRILAAVLINQLAMMSFARFFQKFLVTVKRPNAKWFQEI